MAGVVPPWVDRSEYPFAPRSFAQPAGRMHFVDEGQGDPVVFVHGNPMWSFEFRSPIKALSRAHRCIAADHLGFGLSDKPEAFDYLPESHADNLERLFESLDLREITLVVQDWGGPIGLSYAIQHPDRVRRLVISNTWMWSVRGSLKFQLFSKLVGGPLGRYRIRTANTFVRGGLQGAYGDPSKLTSKVHAQYIQALATPADRKGCSVFPGQIIGSSRWLGRLWERRDRLSGQRVLLAWGMKDFGFGAQELERWRRLFPEASVVRFPDVGHWLAEEDPVGLTKAIQGLVRPAG